MASITVSNLPGCLFAFFQRHKEVSGTRRQPVAQRVQLRLSSAAFSRVSQRHTCHPQHLSDIRRKATGKNK